MKRWINILISVVITLLFLRVLALLLKDADFTGIWQADLFFIAPAVLCYIITYPLRAFRIYYLTRRFGTRFFDILPICFRHQFYGRIIPFKAGELSLVYLLNKNCSVPVLSGGAVLGFIRLFDAGVMLTVFLVCSIFVKISDFVTAACVFVLIILVLGALVGAVFSSKIYSVARRKQNKVWKAAEQICGFFHNTSAKEILVLLMQTAVLWLFVYLSMHFVAKAFYPSISIIQSVSASFLASAAAFLPVNGLGGFGTTEAGWTVGFMLLGMERETALISGLTSNIMSFVIVCVFGAISFVRGGNRRCMK